MKKSLIHLAALAACGAPSRPVTLRGIVEATRVPAEDLGDRWGWVGPFTTGKNPPILMGIDYGTPSGDIGVRAFGRTFEDGRVEVTDIVPTGPGTPFARFMDDTKAGRMKLSDKDLGDMQGAVAAWDKFQAVGKEHLRAKQEALERRINDRIMEAATQDIREGQQAFMQAVVTGSAIDRTWANGFAELERDIEQAKNRRLSEALHKLPSVPGASEFNRMQDVFRDVEREHREGADLWCVRCGDTPPKPACWRGECKPFAGRSLPHIQGRAIAPTTCGPSTVRECDLIPNREEEGGAS